MQVLKIEKNTEKGIGTSCRYLYGQGNKISTIRTLLMLLGFLMVRLKLLKFFCRNVKMFEDDNENVF